ncbi:MAG: DNA-3-methyladenine glycosylase family protein [Microcoleus sp.]
MATISQSVARTAQTHLSTHDEILAPIIQAVGLCTIVPHQNYYQELVGSIVSQQLSVKATATIFGRFVDLFGGTFPEPAAILEKSIEELRSVGLSGQKATYIRDLAQHVIDGQVRFDHLDNLSNDEIIAELTAVKGIGDWTVHMFLMFCMGRSDVLPAGDLGIRNGIQKLYGLSSLPSVADINIIAKEHNWHPYESIACWYIWQSLDNTPKL